jgi:hypothetical protein
LNSAPIAVCFSSEKNIVFAAQSHATRQPLLTAWTIDPEKRKLQQISELALPFGRVASIHPTASTLWMASDRGMIAVELDAQTGTPRAADRVSSIPNLRSMAVV